MTWNHRQGGSWSAPTVKRRANGQWVEIAGGGGGDDGGGGGETGDVPDRYYTTDPGRGAGDGSTGADIIVPDDYSTIQAAHDAASAGDRIWIDPSSGPYAESVSVSQNHITFDGWDPDTSTRAVVETPDETSRAFTCRGGGGETIGPGYPDETSLAQSIDGDAGETVISVADASAISASPGELIHIWEDRNPYGEGSDIAGTTQTVELRFVEDIDTTNDTVTVDHQMLLPFPNNNETRVGSMEGEYHARDVQWYGLDIDGQGKSTEQTDLFYIGQTYEPWLQNMSLSGVGEYRADFIIFNECFRVRVDDIDITAGDHYGINTMRGSNRMYYTNISATDIQRYATRFGANKDQPAVDALVRGLYGSDTAGDNQIAKSHYGGFFLRWERVESDLNSSCIRCASRNMTLDGFTDVDDGSNSEQPIFFARVNSGITIKNTPNYVDGWDPDAGLPSGRDDSFFWRWDFSNTDMNEHGEDYTFENITIESDGSRSINDLGDFRWDDTTGTAEIESLTFHNVWYDGQWLEQSHVESWQSYDSSRIGSLSVTNDGGTPPGV